MVGVGIAAFVLSYALIYTGVANLLNGGQGPGFAESLGITTKLASPASYRAPQGSGNQTGQTPASTQLAVPQAKDEVST